MIPLQILAQVDPTRLKTAVDSFVSGAFTVTLTSHSEAEIRGFVANGDGKEYGLVLSEGKPFCSCKDAIYRKAICKHAVALALFTLRQPLTEKPHPHCGDQIQHQGHVGRVVCVSGDEISVAWDTGKTTAHKAAELSA